MHVFTIIILIVVVLVCMHTCLPFLVGVIIITISIIIAIIGRPVPIRTRSEAFLCSTPDSPCGPAEVRAAVSAGAGAVEVTSTNGRFRITARGRDGKMTIEEI